MSHHRACACTHCRCRNFAQEPDCYYHYDGESDAYTASCSLEPTPTLCLVCERAELAGKNEPTYSGCLCSCKCRLQREDGSPLCGDCGEQNRRNPRRHRAHGDAKAR
ncbi:hypothetical protein F4821DRAFT_258731 [Hypoxylon rubiginosum]|uniref:Uncharacterized protein n=1 Tax=Hypoxylon rubiginosum TaxID=110542 RepID=A0ACC0D4L9_9PEZI|nr:hypothetical protein F4821DRAFT_258731 [Hypoxylon rubiginosum]